MFYLRPTKYNTKKKPPLVKSIEMNSEKETLINYCFKCDRPMTFLKDLMWYKCDKCGKLKKSF